jgi:hypothetical protein
MRTRFLTLLIAFVVSLAASSSAQGIYLDNVEGLGGPIEDSTIIADGATEIVFNLRLVGLQEVSRGLTAGFRVYSDGDATWTTTEFDTLNVGISWSEMWDSIGGFFINPFSVTGSGADTIGIGALGIINGLPAGFDAVAFSITIGPIPAEHQGKTICLDSCFYPPIGYWVLAGSNGSFGWDGPHCFTLVSMTGVADDDNGLPRAFALRQNYPNPFNPSTEILFDVPKKSHVKIAIYNVLGQKVKCLVDEELPPGEYSRIWDGTSDTGESVSTGVYLYRLESPDYRQSRKMILLK